MKIQQEKYLCRIKRNYDKNVAKKPSYHHLNYTENLPKLSKTQEIYKRHSIKIPKLLHIDSNRLFQFSLSGRPPSNTHFNDFLKYYLFAVSYIWQGSWLLYGLYDFVRNCTIRYNSDKTIYPYKDNVFSLVKYFQYKLRLNSYLQQENKKKIWNTQRQVENNYFLEKINDDKPSTYIYSKIYQNMKYLHNLTTFNKNCKKLNNYMCLSMGNLQYSNISLIKKMDSKKSKSFENTIDFGNECPLNKSTSKSIKLLRNLKFESNKDNKTEHALAIPTFLYIIFAFSLASNISWLLIWQQNNIIVALIFVNIMDATLYATLIVSVNHLKCVMTQLNIEIWMFRLFLQNGLAFYATVGSVAALYIFSNTMSNGPYEEEEIINSSDISATIIFCINAVGWWIVDTFIYLNELRYIYTPYFVYIITLFYLLIVEYHVELNYHKIMVIILLIIVTSMFILKIVFLCFHVYVKKFKI
ncbi:hypothetical protein A3Q56_04769 [Intoshia linei]|uniref:Uncharacterized protein n=1 Tax=Intoshia linei TaxID=1819745 RepID=A0A177AZN2_9BILA|nr:hypothetical protein A3Q56_04769 [Intoshia linei]